MREVDKVIDLSFMAGQRIGVLGLARSGLATVETLRAGGAQVLAWDDRAEAQAAAEALGAEIADLTQADVREIVIAPGIPTHLPKAHPVAAYAIQNGIPLIGDIELLARSQPKAKLVGITGTNGKSTTTALAGHILAQAGMAVEVAGNIGRPVLSITDPGADGVILIELSSYQLETVQSLALDVACWLNLAPDHLERHGDLAGYRAAKAHLFDHPRGQAQAFVGEAELAALVPQGWAVEGISEKGLDLSKCRALKGAHNAQNAAMAAAICRTLGLDEEQIQQGLESFSGLAHRQELVAEINGIAYINDSKATNADAAARALACYEPIYWIAGGQPKSDGLSGLEIYAPRIRRGYLIGTAAEAFAAWMQAQEIPAEISRTLDSAVQAAHERAQQEALPGGTVLFSPAAASFDQFTDFEARGAAFRAAVQYLQEEAA